MMARILIVDGGHPLTVSGVSVAAFRARRRVGVGREGVGVGGGGFLQGDV